MKIPRFVKITVAISLCVLCMVLVWVIGFDALCSAPLRENAPSVQGPDGVLEYSRPEVSTYLTLPEWYTVYSYQEYAQFIEKQKPSKFPYFASIGQFWGSYCFAQGATEDIYPFSKENHLMLSVIGVSFSAEYFIKGIYEHSFGALTEMFSYTTQEDRYAVQIAYDYGAFIPTDPWYMFPFGERAVGLWTHTDIFGWDFVRKTERKYFLTIENGVKSLYASVIRAGTGAVYGAPDAVDYARVKGVPQKVDERVKIVRQLDDGTTLIALPHYQGFTDVVPTLMRQGMRFQDISGNDEIMLTAIVPKEYVLVHGVQVYEMKILTQPDFKRIAIRTDVRTLHEVILELDEAGVTIEHLYDY